MEKTSIFEISEYDIDQKIIDCLANVCSRSVLFSIIPKSKDATQISKELNISQSTVYKTLATLEDLALATVDEFIISPEGKKIKKYRSRISKAEIVIVGMKPILNLHPLKE